MYTMKFYVSVKKKKKIMNYAGKLINIILF